MIRPPVWMRLQVYKKDRRTGLWLPLFLLWPVVLAVLLILSPLILIAVVVLWPFGWGEWVVRVLGAAGRIVCSLRGLRVDIQNRYQTLYISVV
jgi:hypothetical protein